MSNATVITAAQAWNLFEIRCFSLTDDKTLQFSRIRLDQTSFKLTKDEKLILRSVISHRANSGLMWAGVGFGCHSRHGSFWVEKASLVFLSYLAAKKLPEKKDKAKPMWRSILEISIRSITQMGLNKAMLSLKCVSEMKRNSGGMFLDGFSNLWLS